LSLEYRDVFVYDPAYVAAKWDTQQPSLKHPLSGHIVAKYAGYIHQNSVYNFNHVGEYSLNVTPICPWEPPGPTNTNNTSSRSDNSDSNSSNSSSGSSEGHTVIIYPDGLQLSGLQGPHDITTVSDLILRESVVTHQQAAAALPHATVGPAPRHMIIASTAALHSPTLAKTVLSWFHAALDDRSRPLCQLFLASDMNKGHRNATSVLILPDEDGFEFVTSASQAKKILAKYFDR
jgi:hypothetical protein